MKVHAAISIALAAGPIAALGADPSFLRGDADGSGRLSITDPILVLRYAFQGGLSPIGCLDAADADDDGKIGLTDAVVLLGYLFQAGPPPAAPFPFPGSDLTEDGLDCQIIPAAEGEELIVFCCDRSASLSGASWKRLQHSVVQAITELGPAAQFALVFFDANLVEFPSSGVPLPATEDMKAAAIQVILSITTGDGSCTKPALHASLGFAKNSRAKSKRLILYSDGRASCGGQDETVYAKATLAEVSAMNDGIAAIDTVGLGPADGSLDENFLRALAAQNGGGYTRIVQ